MPTPRRKKSTPFLSILAEEKVEASPVVEHTTEPEEFHFTSPEPQSIAEPDPVKRERTKVNLLKRERHPRNKPKFSQLRKDV